MQLLPALLSTVLFMQALFPVAALAAENAGRIVEADVLAVMSSSDRLPADLERDPRSKPQVVIPLLDISPGDRVVDIFGSGGYYSELLGRVLGASGEAVLHNSPGFEAWGINGLTDRFTDRDPGNVTRLTVERPDLGLGEGTFEAALLVMAFHDLYVVPKRYNGEEYVPVGEPADVDNFLAQVYASLKPGGRFVVVDHAGHQALSVDDNAELHRIEEGFARREIERRGFRYVTGSEVLRNRADDRSMIVFDLDVQGKTDRFVLVFEKP